nr:MAG TPA: hypothetical protein [Caudoviricetes sp.]
MRFEIFETPKSAFFVLSNTFNIISLNKHITFIY